MIRENEETPESNVKRQKTDDGFDAFQVLESIKKNLEGDEDTKWKDFKMFLILASENKFPFENISILLFLDVVRWISVGECNKMRYSDTSKQFWRAGKKLLKDKFIRFVKGPTSHYRFKHDSMA